MDYDNRRIAALQAGSSRDPLPVDDVVVNGSVEHRYREPEPLFAYVEGESLLMGSRSGRVERERLHSASLEPSYVLRALGVDEDMAHTSIRFGIGRFTTEAEIDRAVELTVQQVRKLREMSPLYEMAKAGIDLKSIQWAQH
ncbi:Cysteine desulfurase, mitochondrial [Ananas comosus]|uniref:Cysteine desulfurase, mitochondrial n=1 Tax=Ananas comosus TaxID=4615 RepID=A0A199V820_ANACO|nr:Cysteine desulfurase, mitochondrial [Ananas comosus]